MKRAAALLAGALLAPLAALAQADEDDAAALQLADRTDTPTERASPWRRFAEIAAGQERRADGSTRTPRRLSLDLRYDGAPAPGWRLQLADRLDLGWPAPSADRHAVNTLKEAFASWQPSAERLLDAGRINVRHGVATGFNPTDWFKAGAVRSLVSLDPMSLKENRQGSVMLRGQQLWAGGSITALASPRLARARDPAAFHLDWGATNGSDRFLLAASQRIAEDLSPQVLLFKAAGQAPQAGVNLAALLGDRFVANVEWAGGRSLSHAAAALRGQGLPYADDTVWRNRVAAGGTLTLPNKLSVTVEWHADHAALGEREWDGLRFGPPAYFAGYLAWVQAVQGLPTRHAAFVYTSWTDALVHRLDLAGLYRRNSADTSSLLWLELRYRMQAGGEFALQWQQHRGGPHTEFGAWPPRRGALAVWRCYL